MQGSVSELHLRFDALQSNHRQVSGRFDHRIEERRLADSGFTPEYHRPTQTATNLSEEGVQTCRLLVPPDQHVPPWNCRIRRSDGGIAWPQLLANPRPVEHPAEESGGSTAIYCHQPSR
jgi:hypothetical protein